MYYLIRRKLIKKFKSLVQKNKKIDSNSKQKRFLKSIDSLNYFKKSVRKIHFIVEYFQISDYFTFFR